MAALPRRTSNSMLDLEELAKLLRLNPNGNGLAPVFGQNVPVQQQQAAANPLGDALGTLMKGATQGWAKSADKGALGTGREQLKGDNASSTAPKLEVRPSATGNPETKFEDPKTNTFGVTNGAPPITQTPNGPAAIATTNAIPAPQLVGQNLNGPNAIVAPIAPDISNAQNRRHPEQNPPPYDPSAQGMDPVQDPRVAAPVLPTNPNAPADIGTRAGLAPPEDASGLTQIGPNDIENFKYDQARAKYDRTDRTAHKQGIGAQIAYAASQFAGNFANGMMGKQMNPHQFLGEAKRDRRVGQAEAEFAPIQGQRDKDQNYRYNDERIATIGRDDAARIAAQKETNRRNLETEASRQKRLEFESDKQDWKIEDRNLYWSYEEDKQNALNNKNDAAHKLAVRKQNELMIKADKDRDARLQVAKLRVDGSANVAGINQAGQTGRVQMKFAHDADKTIKQIEMAVPTTDAEKADPAAFEARKQEILAKLRADKATLPTGTKKRRK